jgi:RNA polymerase sigma-70 factor, ECF subfamily
VEATDPRAAVELARRARRGDASAFDQLVLRFQRPVYRLCWRMLRSSHAEDLAQETFVRAFVHFERFDPERPMLPWLLTIARRLCLDLLRRERAEATTAVPAPVDPFPSPERHAVVRDELARLERALADLDVGPREAIVLYHVEALSYRDIAAVLDVPIGTVMTWLHRGRAQLKRALDDPRDPGRFRPEVQS